MEHSDMIVTISVIVVFAVFGLVLAWVSRGSHH